MTTANKTRLNKKQVLALRGIRLPQAALKLLREAGIYCEPAVAIGYQHLAKRHVMLGRESGGAVAQVGAYCGFAGLQGEGLCWLNRISSIGRNGVHACVVAPAFVRLQVFRNDQTFELLITSHELKPRPERKRPALENSVLFHGTHGVLPEGVLPLGSQSFGQILPAFHDHSGESVTIPVLFEEVARRAIAGACCIGCHVPHVLLSPAIREEVRDGTTG